MKVCTSADVTAGTVTVSLDGREVKLSLAEALKLGRDLTSSIQCFPVDTSGVPGAYAHRQLDMIPEARGDYRWQVGEGWRQ